VKARGPSLRCRSAIALELIRRFAEAPFSGPPTLDKLSASFPYSMCMRVRAPSIALSSAALAAKSDFLACFFGLDFGRSSSWHAKHAVSLGHLDSGPLWLGLEPGAEVTASPRLVILVNLFDGQLN